MSPTYTPTRTTFFLCARDINNANERTGEIQFLNAESMSDRGLKHVILWNVDKSSRAIYKGSKKWRMNDKVDPKVRLVSWEFVLFYTMKYHIVRRYTFS